MTTIKKDTIYSSKDLTRKESSRCNVIDQLEAYEERVSGITRKERDLVPALALRCYHLPGYSCCDDWLQYFQNNHPIFGICCHHRLHPIGFQSRLLLLIGSITFGLSVTNIIFLWFYYSGSDQNNPAVTVNVNGFGNVDSEQASQGTFEITQGMVLLWTVGGLLHAVFDNTAWYMSACVCCLSSRRWDKFKSCGTWCVVVTVVFFTVIATLAVVLRTSAEHLSIYKYLISYATELVLALFVYYPLIGTVLFTGILGCGNVPILGGRPYEVKMEAKRIQKMTIPNSDTESASEQP
jgi:hypothetical protein